MFCKSCGIAARGGLNQNIRGQAVHRQHVMMFVSSQCAKYFGVCVIIHMELHLSSGSGSHSTALTLYQWWPWHGPDTV